MRRREVTIEIGCPVGQGLEEIAEMLAAAQASAKRWKRRWIWTFGALQILVGLMVWGGLAIWWWKGGGP